MLINRSKICIARHSRAYCRLCKGLDCHGGVLPCFYKTLCQQGVEHLISWGFELELATFVWLCITCHHCNGVDEELTELAAAVQL